MTTGNTRGDGVINKNHPLFILSERGCELSKLQTAQRQTLPVEIDIIATVHSSFISSLTLDKNKA